MHAVMGELRDVRERHGGEDATLTFGRLTVSPNNETAQAGRVTFSADFRSPDRAFLAAADTATGEIIARVANRTSLAVSRTPILIEEPVEFDREIRDMIKTSSDRRGYRSIPIWSGAGHDAQVLARHVPTAMIFAPSADGRSHCPEEYTSTPDIERAVSVLYDVTVSLTTEPHE
jgi:acetylornithine deacetylase/succinyl-diaminopimelate desuccinylase-like protein